MTVVSLCVLKGAFRRGNDIVGLRHRGLFQIKVEGNGNVQPGDDFDRRVEAVELLFLYVGRDVEATPPRRTASCAITTRLVLATDVMIVSVSSGDRVRRLMTSARMFSAASVSAASIAFSNMCDQATIVTSSPSS